MTKRQRREIERELYNYEENKKKAAEYVASHAFDGFSFDFTVPRVKRSQTNEPERRVVEEIGVAERNWKWCLVYEKTLDRFRWTLKDKLMQMRYIEKNHECYILDKIGISRSTYFYWVEDILQVAYLWAQEYDLI